MYLNRRLPTAVTVTADSYVYGLILSIQHFDDIPLVAADRDAPAVLVFTDPLVERAVHMIPRHLFPVPGFDVEPCRGLPHCQRIDRFERYLDLGAALEDNEVAADVLPVADQRGVDDMKSLFFFQGGDLQVKGVQSARDTEGNSSEQNGSEHMGVLLQGSKNC